MIAAALLTLAVTAGPVPPAPSIVDEGWAVSVSRAAALSTLSAYGVTSGSKTCSLWRANRPESTVDWVWRATWFPWNTTAAQQKRGVRQALDARCW